MSVCFAKKIYRMIFPKRVREVIFFIRTHPLSLLKIKKILEHNRILERYKERFESFGEDYPDKTFYVIYIRYATNIISFIRCIIPYLQYAENKGWIPIIDQKTYRYNFLGERYEGTENDNIWEMFFEQPLGYSLDDIKRAKNVCYCNPLSAPEGYAIPKGADSLSEDMLSAFTKYIRLKEDAKKKIVNLANKCNFNQKKKYVGINVRCEMLRGALLKKNLYINHKYSSKDQVLSAIENVKAEYDCGKYGVYIICDDSFVKVNLAKHFDSYDTAWVERHFYIASFFENGDLSKPLPDKVMYKRVLNADFIQHVENFYEYLADVYALSRCDIVVCGEDDSAPFMATLFKGSKFSKYIFFDANVFHGSTSEKKYLYEDKGGYVALR